MWQGAVVTHIISEGKVECDSSLEGTSLISAYFSTFISEQVEFIAFVNAMTCFLRLLAHTRGALLLHSLQQAREASSLGLVAFDRFRCSVSQWWYLAGAWAEVRPKSYTFCQRRIPKTKAPSPTHFSQKHYAMILSAMARWWCLCLGLLQQAMFGPRRFLHVHLSQMSIGFERNHILIFS